MVRIPACVRCVHLSAEGKGTCDAYPDGIPEDYVEGTIDIEEIEECANGIKYENKYQAKAS